MYLVPGEDAPNVDKTLGSSWNTGSEEVFFSTGREGATSLSDVNTLLKVEGMSIEDEKTVSKFNFFSAEDPIFDAEDSVHDSTDETDKIMVK